MEASGSPGAHGDLSLRSGPGQDLGRQPGLSGGAQGLEHQGPEIPHVSRRLTTAPGTFSPPFPAPPKLNKLSPSWPGWQSFSFNTERLLPDN